MQIELYDITTDLVFGNFRKREPNSHKGSYGKALLICGSYGMAGAAIICGKACIHSGVGIANIICQESVYPIISAALPEAVFTPIDKEFNDNDAKKVISAIKSASVIVIGCGMGQSDYTTKLLDCVISHATAPIIIDADGINCLSHNIDLLLQATSPIILTPHPAEMARLIGCSVTYLLEHKMSIMEEFVGKYNCTLVLKTHETVVMTPPNQAYINHTGNAGMATAGSGDMLCGIMASFLAQGLDITQAATSAVHIHGICGDLSAEKYSMMFTTPSTMQKMLPLIFSQLEKSLDKD